MASSPSRESRRELFEGSVSGAQDRPWIPRLRSDPHLDTAPPHSLVEFRAQEGVKARERHFRELWERLPDAGTHLLDHEPHAPDDTRSGSSMPSKEAHKMVQQYEDELMGRCHGSMGPLRKKIRWKEFCSYVEAKETELWTIFHDELDLDGNGHLDVQELSMALERAGIKMPPGSMSDFMTYMTASPHSHSISFTEFRDFLLLLPRRASTAEIYRYYEVRKSLDPDSRGASRVNMEGDVSLSAEDHHLRALPSQAGPSSAADTTSRAPVDHEAHPDDDHDLTHHHEEEEHHYWLGGATALKFLLAGGAAGAVSRTCTAPFDRLKIFLITRPPDLGGTPLTSLKPQASLNGARAIGNAVHRIYLEGGIRGFWTGNALSVAKIFPESAIKFLSYESSKRLFAEYYDEVSDTRNISGISRFLSGGIAGITSQLSIYPIETLKTRMMSSTGESKRSLSEAIVHLYRLGGMRAYYRGLTIGLIGVFPYAAIDMSTFEALKLAYLQSTGKTDPGVLAVLAFGSVSGSVGASMVYPLNLVRTRLQAAGSSGHPQQYTGFRDVVSQTYARDGWRGFYRGLIPTLTKVVPAVSISYVVYESSKRHLGV